MASGAVLRAACSGCLRSFSLTAAGLIRTHGPVDNRCPGSRKLPAARPASTSEASQSGPCGTDHPAPPPLPPAVRLDHHSPQPPLRPIPPVRVLKRIPRASRGLAGMKLASILEDVVSKNDVTAWERLLHFSVRCLRTPARCGRNWSLATLVNRQLREEEDPPTIIPSRRGKGKGKAKDPMESLGHRVSEKLEEGDFKGAVRLACSEDSIADRNDATFAALKEKHPPPHPDSSIPSPPDSSVPLLTVSVEDVAQAIKSFPNGSAGGPDGLRPQHLKDMTNSSNVEASSLLTALASFSSLVLEGKPPPAIRPFLFGATLVALDKKGGGVRPIAIGCTLRRLVAKIAGSKVVNDASNLLSPRQLGYGISGGAEAAVHATRLYLDQLQPDHALIKLDFRNAFNSVRRDKMLRAVQDLAPSIYPFVHSVYSSPSSLFWDDRTLVSSEGVQQGDPLGPLLFCLAIYRHSTLLSAEFCVEYLDDITLGGPTEEILHDLEVIESFAEIGLILNNQKSEIICDDPVTRGSIIMTLPGARVVEPSRATLLGSPIGNTCCISAALKDKINALEVMGGRLQHITAHDGILLLRNSFSIPKLLYTLRTSPCFLSANLSAYDVLLKSIVSNVTNIRFGDDDPAWTQATLPVRYGGLGFRSAVQLAPSAYLASAAASSGLISHILPASLQSLPIPHLDAAVSLWSHGHDTPPPSGTAACSQKSWDTSVVSSTAESLLEGAPDDITRARLLAVSTKESGAWLHALPISSLGLRMDDNTVRVAVGLRLGSSLCRPHTCQHCGADVDQLATHGLSCKKSEGRHYRHGAINDILHRALTTAGIPSRLEPPGLVRTDGKRPDGVTMIPWRNGKPIVWDATCPDTLARSYRCQATSRAGAVADLAEERKSVKYTCLGAGYSFTPVAIETLGAMGKRSLAFVRELGHRVMQSTGEVKARTYLLQRLSVALQRGNAVSVMGSVGSRSGLDLPGVYPCCT